MEKIISQPPQKRPFDPNNRQYRFYLWVRRRTKTGSLVHIYWRRIILLVGGTLALGWFAAAAAAMTFLHVSRGISEVTYVDLAFPWRWKNYSRTVGRHYLAAGHTALTNGSYMGALANLNAGLAKVPEDIESRRLLSVLQFKMGRSDLAAETLASGLPYLPRDPAHLDRVFGLLREMQANDTVIALAHSLLPPATDDVVEHLYLALQLANAQFALGHIEECQATVATWRLDRAPAGEVLLARCDWETGRTVEAIKELQDSLKTFRVRDEIYVTLVRFFQEENNVEQMRHYAFLHYLENPAIPDTRLDLIYAYAETKEESGLKQEEQHYLTDFAANPQALAMLANVAALSGRPDLARDAYQAAKPSAKNLLPFRLALIEADISAKEYEAAVTDLDAGRAELTGASKTESVTVRGLEATARFGVGDPATADALLKLLLVDARYLRPAEALSLAKAMRLAGGSTEAYQLLQVARDTDPKNQAAILEIVRADVDAKNHEGLIKNLPAFVALQRPDRTLARSALPLLNRPEDATLRSTLRHLVAAPGQAAASQP